MVSRLLLLVITLHVAVSLATLLGPGGWRIIEVSRNLGFYHLVGHLVELALLFVVGRRLAPYARRISATLLLLLVLALSRPIIPMYSTPPRAEGEHRLRVLSMNVQYGCCDAEAVASLVRGSAADLVVIIEGGSRFFEMLRLEAELPYSEMVRREDPFALGVYSRYPVEWEPIQFEEPELPPVLFGTLRHPSGSGIRFGIFHSVPPTIKDSLTINHLLVRRITNKVRHISEPTILISDMNATPYSPFYQRLVVNAELEHAFAGRGWYGSWNARLPFVRLPLDHIWYKGGLRAEQPRILDEIGSDHYPLQVDLRW